MSRVTRGLKVAAVTTLGLTAAAYLALAGSVIANEIETGSNHDALINAVAQWLPNFAQVLTPAGLYFGGSAIVATGVGVVAGVASLFLPPRAAANADVHNGNDAAALARRLEEGMPADTAGSLNAVRGSDESTGLLDNNATTRVFQP